MALPFLEKIRLSNIYNIPGNRPGIGGDGYGAPIRPRQGISFSPNANFNYGGPQVNPAISAMMQQQRQEQKPMDVQFQSPPSESLAGHVAGIKAEADIAKLNQNLGIKEAELDFKTKKHEDELAIKQQRANVYEFRAKNPNSVMKEVNGRIVAVNPQTNQMVDLGAAKDFTEQEKIELTHQKALELEGVKQEGRKEIEGTRQEGRISIERTRGEEARRTNLEKPPTSGNTELEKRRGMENRASQALIEHPEWDDYIEFTDNGVRFNPPNDDVLAREIRTRLIPPRGDIKLPTSTTPGKPVTPDVKVAGGLGTAGKATAQERTLKNKAGKTKVQVSTDGGKTWKDK